MTPPPHPPVLSSKKGRATTNNAISTTLATINTTTTTASASPLDKNRSEIDLSPFQHLREAQGTLTYKQEKVPSLKKKTLPLLQHLLWPLLICLLLSKDSIPCIGDVGSFVFWNEKAVGANDEKISRDNRSVTFPSKYISMLGHYLSNRMAYNVFS